MAGWAGAGRIDGEMGTDYVASDAAQVPDRWGPVLTVGFATAAGMWTVGYFARLPLVLPQAAGTGEPWQPAALLPSSVLFAAMLSIPIAAGWVAGCWLKPGQSLGAGLVAGLINLLVLGGALSKETSPELMAASVVWLPASILITAALVWVGRQIHVRMATGRRPIRDGGPDLSAVAPATVAAGPSWPAALAWTAVAITTVLLIVGGNVTGMKAGLAVADWPNSFGYNMFLYPFSKMSGGVYFEHSHRLFGSLVGVTVLTLAVYLHFRDPRGWLRGLAWCVFALVCVQGVLGGLRVTGKLTLSTDAADMAPNLAMALAHGVLAQLVYSSLVAIAVFSSRRWVAGPAALRAQAATNHVARGAAGAAHRAAEPDRAGGLLLVAVLIVQIILGAVFRHYNQSTGLYLHLGFAAVAIGVALVIGVRSWMLDDAVPVLPVLGERLVIATLVQAGLGAGALVGVWLTTQAGHPVTIEVLLTTAHQTMGAILLAMAVTLALWQWRLVGAAAPSTHSSLVVGGAATP